VSKPDEEWLKEYYSRLQSEYEYSTNKKDTLTNWSLTILVGMLAIYFGLTDSVQLSGWLRFALLIGTLIILIQFFVNSLLAYGFLRKWRMLKEEIENYWMKCSPSLDKIKQDIENYDHGRRLNVGLKGMIWAQLMSGFLLILSAPILLSVYEISRISQWTSGYYVSIIVLGIYLLWQFSIFARYDQFKKFKS
jgi:hypothetical protein